MSETDLSRSIRDALAKLGVWCIRSGVSIKRGHGGTNSGEPGQPDLCLPALGWLESKVGKGEPSTVQLAWHSRAQREGVNVAVVRSVADAIRVVAEWRGKHENLQRIAQSTSPGDSTGVTSQGPSLRRR